MWSIAQQNFPFPEGFAHQRKFQVLQVAQPTVNEASGPTGSTATKVPFLDQEGFQSPQCGIARDSSSIDAPSNNDQVVLGSLNGVQIGHSSL